MARNFSILTQHTLEAYNILARAQLNTYNNKTKIHARNYTGNLKIPTACVCVYRWTVQSCSAFPNILWKTNITNSAYFISYLWLIIFRNCSLVQCNTTYERRTTRERLNVIIMDAEWIDIISDAIFVERSYICFSHSAFPHHGRPYFSVRTTIPSHDCKCIFNNSWDVICARLTCAT